MTRITDFLAIDRFAGYDTGVHLRPQPSILAGSPVTAADIEHLVDLYAEDLAQFAAVSGLDVTGWPTARVAADELTPADLAERLHVKAGLRS